MTRGVVAGFAFGALVIAGGALVAAGPVSAVGPRDGAHLAGLGSRLESRAGVVPADAGALSLPSFARDGRARPAVADLGRAAARARRRAVSRERGDDTRADAWGVERTRSTSEETRGAKSAETRRGDAEELDDVAERFEATLAFAKPRPEDTRERRARTTARKTREAMRRAETPPEERGDGALERASGAALRDLAERERDAASDDVFDATDAEQEAEEEAEEEAAVAEEEKEEEEEEETLDDLFEPADGAVTEAKETETFSLDALAAEAASEMGEARGEDAAPEPEDPAESEPEDPAESEPEDPAESEPEDPAESGAEDPAESGAEDPAESEPEDPAESGAEDADVDRAPNIVPGMTYEEQQAEYGRFAEAEAARNDAIAAEAERRNREAAEAAAAAEGAPSTDAAKEAFEAEEARRRAEFEAEAARRRAEFEARPYHDGEAALGEDLDSLASGEAVAAAVDDSSEGVAASDAASDDVSSVTERLQAALGAAAAARRRETRVAVGADGVVVRARKTKEPKHEAKHATKTTSNAKTSSKTSLAKKPTKADEARGWSAGDDTALRALSRRRRTTKRAGRVSESSAGSVRAKRVRDISRSPPASEVSDADASRTRATTDAGASRARDRNSATTSMLERRLAASAEKEAAAAAAADEEALRVDTTLDAVQQAIAEQRRDDAPAATLMLAPLSVVGVAGVVVIAILLVRHRAPRGARATSVSEGETASLVRGGDATRDVEAGTSAADALVKTSDANLSALFGGAFATPSETDVESAAEAEGEVSRRRGRPETFADPRRLWAAAFDRARAAAESAERFSSSRVSALRASVERTRRMVASAARGDEASGLGAAPPSERDGGATPTSPRGSPPASVLDVSGEVSASGAFSAAEMRDAEARARRDGLAKRPFGAEPSPGRADASLRKSPPSSFADPVSVPGSPARAAPADPGRASTERARGALVSEDARRRFQRAAATSAHARAFAAPPRPHLRRESAGAAAEAAASRTAVTGAGRVVAPPPEGPPATVKSTTRFL